MTLGTTDSSTASLASRWKENGLYPLSSQTLKEGRKETRLEWLAKKWKKLLVLKECFAQCVTMK